MWIQSRIPSPSLGGGDRVVEVAGGGGVDGERVERGQVAARRVGRSARWRPPRRGLVLERRVEAALDGRARRAAPRRRRARASGRRAARARGRRPPRGSASDHLARRAPARTAGERDAGAGLEQRLGDQEAATRATTRRRLAGSTLERPLVRRPATELPREDLRSARSSASSSRRSRVVLGIGRRAGFPCPRASPVGGQVFADRQVERAAVVQRRCTSWNVPLPKVRVADDRRRGRSPRARR